MIVKISLDRGNHLLSGFGTDNYLKDYHTDRKNTTTGGKTYFMFKTDLISSGQNHQDF